MATYYFRNATATWGTATNWSLTSGGGATGAIPTSNDDVIFDSNSRATCTLNSNRDCRSISFTNWTGDIAFNNVFLRIYGNIDCGSALFTISSPGSWQMGGTIGVMNGQTIRTNGKTLSGTLSFGYTSGTTSVVLLDDVVCGSLQNQSNIGTSSFPIFTGYTLSTQSNIQTTSTGRNLFTTTPIKMIGTGSIITFNSNAALGCDIEINTSGTITLSGAVYATTNFVFTYTSGTVVSTGGTLYINLAPSTIDCSGITLNSVVCNNTITLNSTLNANNIEFGSGGTCTLQGTSGFNVNNFNFILSGRDLNLKAGITYTINNSMTCLGATLAARNAIKCSTVAGTRAILNLSPGATQDNGYLSSTDIDSSGGVTIWTYKGVLTREINWNQLSTDPRKHLFRYSGGTKIIKY